MKASNYLDGASVARIRAHQAVCAEQVRDLGDRIGYGNMMQLAEQIWEAKCVTEGLPGGAHSVGCCVVFLVPCPGCSDKEGSCDWCCGAGRVTKKVAEVMSVKGAR